MHDLQSCHLQKCYISLLVVHVAGHILALQTFRLKEKKIKTRNFLVLKCKLTLHIYRMGIINYKL